jgi:hypothetical protein
MRLPRQLVAKVEIYCAVNKLDFQDAVSEGLELYLARETGRLDVQPSTINDSDELMTDDMGTSPSSSLFPDSGRPAVQRDRELLRFYAEQTGNQVKERDRESVTRLLQFDDSSIKAGILKSILLCQTRVNSLAYCEGAIAEIAESGSGVEYLEYLARKLHKPRPGGQPNLPGVGGDLADLRRKA